MQRIALSAFVVGSLVLAGCAPQRTDTVRPLPPPPLATIPPRVVRPLRPPEPPPTPPPAATEYNTADWMPRGGLKRKWRTIVVHHSAAPAATPQGMDTWHRQRGWENGLGYHFVIGNGVNFGDGRVFVGPRWKAQIQGAHCKSASGRYFGVFRGDGFFNEQGIGICLIGDFDKGSPTPRQLAALRTLIRFLCDKADVPATMVYGHGEVTHKTACPGRHLNMSIVRRAVAMSDNDWAAYAASAGADAAERFSGLPGLDLDASIVPEIALQDLFEDCDAANVAAGDASEDTPASACGGF